jgi:hypothetical protein
MNDLYKDEVDVEWTCVMLGGQPLLVLQATGPVLSGKFMSANYKALKLRFLYDEELKVDTFVCFDEMRFDAPILACDPDPMLHPLREAITNGTAWGLALQYKVGEDEFTRIFVTEKEVTSLLTETGDVPRWICGLQ